MKEKDLGSRVFMASLVLTAQGCAAAPNAGNGEVEPTKPTEERESVDATIVPSPIPELNLDPTKAIFVEPTATSIPTQIPTEQPTPTTRPTQEAEFTADEKQKDIGEITGMELAEGEIRLEFIYSDQLADGQINFHIQSWLGNYLHDIKRRDQLDPDDPFYRSKESLLDQEHVYKYAVDYALSKNLLSYPENNPNISSNSIEGIIEEIEEGRIVYLTNDKGNTLEIDTSKPVNIILGKESKSYSNIDDIYSIYSGASTNYITHDQTGALVIIVPTFLSFITDHMETEHRRNIEVEIPLVIASVPLAFFDKPRALRHLSDTEILNNPLYAELRNMVGWNYPERNIDFKIYDYEKNAPTY